jgi:hypothetical protein
MYSFIKKGQLFGLCFAVIFVVAGYFSLRVSAEQNPLTFLVAPTSIVSTSSAYLSWTTSTSSKFQIFYSTDLSYAQSSATSSNWSTIGTSTLVNLLSSTTYNFKIVVLDVVGNVASTTGTFETDNYLAISNIAVSQISTSSALVVWNTSMQATATLNYGISLGYGSTTSSVTATTSHSLTLTGLKAATTYYYEIIANDLAGTVVASSGLVFLTDSIAAPVITKGAVIVSTSSASVSWSTNVISQGQIFYGTSTNYTASTSNSGWGRNSTTTIDSLTASTTYFYKIFSWDGDLNLSSTTGSFLTDKFIYISGINASPATSSATITWQTNKTATSSVDYGISGSYGLVATSAVAGISHSLKLTGLAQKTLYHYRVTSKDLSGNATTSADLTFMSLDDQPPAILTLDVSSITTSSASFAVTFDEPVYGGDFYYGLDKLSYSNHLAIADAATDFSTVANGLIASSTYFYNFTFHDATGNATSVTRSFVTDKLPTISSISTSSVSNHAVTVNWLTNKLTTARIDYGLDSSYGSSTIVSEARLDNTVTLTGLATSTTYHYKITADDMLGNSTSTADLVLETSSTTDAVAPSLLNLNSAEIGTSSAKIVWTSNEPAVAQVFFGTTTNYTDQTDFTTSWFRYSTSTLSGLFENTQYFYKLSLLDPAGNISSSTSSFITDKLPVITNLSTSSITHNSANIRWQTNKLATSSVMYGLTAGYGSTSYSNIASTTQNIVLNNLIASTTYHFKTYSRDLTNNSTSSDDLIFVTSPSPDITAPTVSNFATSSLTSTGITVSWNTSELATSSLQYGLTTSYGSTTYLNTLTGSHVYNISGLNPSTNYHFKITSKDATGNSTTSTDQTFTTSIGTIANLVFSPDAGIYSTSQTISITCSTPSVDIFYTVNGGEPTISSAKYSSSTKIIIMAGGVLKAVAVKAGYASSSIYSVLYLYNQNNNSSGGGSSSGGPSGSDSNTLVTKVISPVADIRGGTLLEIKKIHLTSNTANAIIYYTLNGTTPTSQSLVYMDFIQISTTTTLKAMATKVGMSASDIITEIYTFQTTASNSAKFSPNYIETTVSPTIKNSTIRVIAGENIVQSGSGFTPNASVKLSFWNRLLRQISSVVKKSNDEGQFSNSYFVKAPVGVYEWQAEDITSGSKSAIVSYTIIPKPLITNSKSQVTRGQIILQKGANFTPNTKVNLYFFQPSKKSVMKTVKTDKKGNFSNSFKTTSRGKFSWQAEDQLTKKKTGKLAYTVK